jgi:hypothetical protein
MKSKEFIKSKIGNLIENFPQLSIRYQYDKNDSTHLIEVMPLCDFNDNANYQNAEAEITFEFEKLFFPETVLFISEESLTKITKPEFVHVPIIISDLVFEQVLEVIGEMMQYHFSKSKGEKIYAGNDYDYAQAA